jgi:hypothetical protein
MSYHESVNMPDPVSTIVTNSLQHRELAPVSQLVLQVPPLAVIPTSNERIVAEGDAARHRGWYA